jgi:hypothetical protein
MSLQTFDDLIAQVRQTCAEFPDPRTGDNTRYSMQDIGCSAFSVFFTQSPSFLSFQDHMQKVKGHDNAQSLFQVEHIPCDNHIRQTLDSVPPERLFPVYDSVYQAFREQGLIETFRAVHQTVLIALDGTWYHSSEKIHCPCCSSLEDKNGRKTYYHSAVTPVIVSPGQRQAIALRPEFITPQDGHTKQDCELAASKRWLEKNSATFAPLGATVLGDDLYAHQPSCRRALLYGFHFIFVCKPQSHKTLSDWVNRLEPGPQLRTVKARVKVDGHWQEHTYRYANQVPLADGDDALQVNWCEVTVTDPKDRVLYHNAFITDFTVDENNVMAIVASGRARWKIENENNNTLKTKGYHLEHNFGHGQKHLSSLLAAMNILAFLFHTFLDFTDGNYRLVRASLPTRKTFFDDVRALTRYLFFSDWAGLMDFMMKGLEIGPYARAS